MLTRKPLILQSTLALLLAGQPLLAQDQLVKQALKKIASVEAAIPKLAAGDVRGAVTGATITSYHFVWDEYRVVTAEKVGDEVWINHNLLKCYHSSDSVTPQDQWILSRRFQSTQILPENLKD